MEQVQKTHSKSKTSEDESLKAAEKDPEIEAHKNHSDELLDEIDALLEENAAEFVKSYVQRGGQ